MIDPIARGRIKRDFTFKVVPLPDQEALAKRQEWFFSYLHVNQFSALKDDFDKPGNTWDPKTELVKLLAGCSSRTNIAIMVNLLDEFYRKDPQKCRQAYAEFLDFKRKVYDLLQDDGVLILPASATAAPFHHGVNTPSFQRFVDKVTRFNKRH